MSPVRFSSFVRLGLILVVCGSSARVDAATLRVRVTDPTGAAVPAAALRLENVASGTEQTANSAVDGSYAFDGLVAGSYRLSARSAGFSEEARFFKVETAEDSIESEVRLSVGNLSTSVTVTAARNLRDSQVIPLRAETLGAAELNRDNPVSTGDFLVRAPGISLVSNGPFQVRPRLRGLDSTRVLILADGERLNNARTATDRAGVEVGLVDPSEIEAGRDRRAARGRCSMEPTPCRGPSTSSPVSRHPATRGGSPAAREGTTAPTRTAGAAPLTLGAVGPAVRGPA